MYKIIALLILGSTSIAQSSQREFLLTFDGIDTKTKKSERFRQIFKATSRENAFEFAKAFCNALYYDKINLIEQCEYETFRHREALRSS